MKSTIFPEQPQKPVRRVLNGCSTIPTVLFFIVWTGATLFFFITAVGMYIRDSRNYNLLLREGIQTQATVIDKQIDDSGDSTDYTITYQFTAPGPQTDRMVYGRSQDVSEKNYDNLLINGPAPIVYARSDPSVSSLKSEFGPPSVFMMLFALVFMAFGLGIPGMMLFAKRKSPETASPLEVQRNPMPFMTTNVSDQGWYNQLEQDGMRCPTCHRPLSAELGDCAHRASGMCPLKVEQQTLKSYHSAGVVVMVIGDALILLGLFLFKDALFCLIPFGIAGNAVGLMLILGRTVAISDPTTGQRFVQNRIGSRVMIEQSNGALQPFRFDFKSSFPRRIPASLAALGETSDTATIFYRTLLSLLAEDALELRYAAASTKLLGRHARQSVALALFPGRTRVSDPAVLGALERKLLESVDTWASRSDTYLKVGNYSLMRENPNFVSLKDVMSLVLGGTVNFPETWLSTNLVGKEAEALGYGRLEGKLSRKFKLDELRQSELLAQSRQDQQMLDAFAAADAAVGSALFPTVQQAITSLRTSSD